jgi:hypothetical protein
MAQAGAGQEQQLAPTHPICNLMSQDASCSGPMVYSISDEDQPLQPLSELPRCGDFKQPRDCEDNRCLWIHDRCLEIGPEVHSMERRRSALRHLAFFARAAVKGARRLFKSTPIADDSRKRRLALISKCEERLDRYQDLIQTNLRGKQTKHDYLVKKKQRSPDDKAAAREMDEERTILKSLQQSRQGLQEAKVLSNRLYDIERRIEKRPQDTWPAPTRERDAVLQDFEAAMQRARAYEKTMGEIRAEQQARRHSVPPRHLVS